MKGNLKILLPCTILLSFAMFTAIAQPAQITADDIFISIEKMDTDITSGEAIFILKNPTNQQILISGDNLKLQKVVSAGGDFIDLKFQVMKVVNVSVNIYLINCTNTTKPQENDTKKDITYEECQQYSSAVQVQREEWRDISSFSMLPQEAKRVKVVGKWKASIGNQAREWIPQITIAGKTYLQSKWAWWNASWDRKIEINLSAVVVPSINYVYSLTLNSTLLNYNYLQPNGTDIRVVNSTEDGVLPFFIDYLNQTTGQNTTLFMNLTNTTVKLYVYYNGTPTVSTANASRVFELASDDCEDGEMASDWVVSSTKHTVKVNATTKMTLGTVNKYSCQWNESGSNNYAPTRKPFTSTTAGYITIEYYARPNTGAGGFIVASSSDVVNCYQGMQTNFESSAKEYGHFDSTFNFRKIGSTIQDGTAWYKVRTILNLTGTHTGNFGINITGNIFSNNYTLLNSALRNSANHPAYIGFCDDNTAAKQMIFDNLKVYKSYENYPTWTGELIMQTPPTCWTCYGNLAFIPSGTKCQIITLTKLCS